MTPQEKQQISELNDNLVKEVELRLIDNGQDGNDDLVRFCDALSDLAPRVRLVREKDASQPTPILRVSPSIAYRGVPSGAEFQPFVELLSAVGKADYEEAGSLDASLAAIDTPANLKLYVSPACPHCPAMVRQIYPLCLMNGNLKLTIINGPAFPELAGADNIMSLPTLILDGGFRWTASIDTGELLRTINHRNPSELGAETLKAIIVEGNAYRLSEMMIGEKMIFPAFLDLLTHAEFSVRLGAMAAIEEVAARDRSVAGQVAAPLVVRYEQESLPVRGDILYVLGMCADSETIPFLRSVSVGTRNGEIREAAEDALQALQNDQNF